MYPGNQLVGFRCWNSPPKVGRCFWKWRLWKNFGAANRCFFMLRHLLFVHCHLKIPHQKFRSFFSVRDILSREGSTALVLTYLCTNVVSCFSFQLFKKRLNNHTAVVNLFVMPSFCANSSKKLFSFLQPPMRNKMYEKPTALSTTMARHPFFY